MLKFSLTVKQWRNWFKIILIHVKFQILNKNHVAFFIMILWYSVKASSLSERISELHLQNAIMNKKNPWDIKQEVHFLEK